MDQEKKVRNEALKEKRKRIRDDFLNNFFVPLRQQYEKDIKKYQDLFPIKEADMSDQAVITHDIYQHGDVVAQRTLDNF